jgi:hypothetical protein
MPPEARRSPQRIRVQNDGSPQRIRVQNDTGLPASLPRNDQRVPATSDVSAKPSSRFGTAPRLPVYVR